MRRTFVAIMAVALLGALGSVSGRRSAYAEQPAPPSAEHQYVVGVSGMT
jgi:hypothetical protein